MESGWLMKVRRRCYGKKIVSIPFGEREELNAFLNQYQIEKKDIINIDYRWNLGLYSYTLTCYAAPDLLPMIDKIIKKDEREKHKAAFISILVIVFLFFLIGCISFFVKMII